MNKQAVILEFESVDFTILLSIALGDRKQEALRAAWALENRLINKPDQFHLHIAAFFSVLEYTRYPSVMRHFSKIVALLTVGLNKKTGRGILEDIHLEPVIDLLFTWLINPDLPVAVKVHSMQALSNLASKNDWIKDELLATIDFQEKYESPAFFARAKHIRKQLKNID